jgi:recombination protein RecT
MGKELTALSDLKRTLATQYQKQINNYFGDEKKALRFLSGVVAAVQRNPKLLECEPSSVINSFMVMAQLELMPSDVSGEAYVLPYNDKKKGMIAQFQLGYQGLVTLFYRAGAKSIVAEIVYEKDEFSFRNGVIDHDPDVFAEDRGEAIGSYVIVELKSGGKVSKVMNRKQIMDIGKKFSKSFYGYDYQTKRKTESVGEHTPWNEKNDPELWMWKKTVLKQAAKLVPKNETIFRAIDEDNKESNVADRMEKAREEAKSLTMGSLMQTNENDENTTEADAAEGGQESGAE